MFNIWKQSSRTSGHFDHGISVANWPNFRPHNSKGAGKKYVRPSKLAAEFFKNICQEGPKTFS
jgi:hypothetical protein